MTWEDFCGHVDGAIHAGLHRYESAFAAGHHAACRVLGLTEGQAGDLREGTYQALMRDRLGSALECIATAAVRLGFVEPPVDERQQALWEDQ